MEFIYIVLPVAVIGVIIYLFVRKSINVESADQEQITTDNKDVENKDEKYNSTKMAFGIGLGLCFGALFSTMIGFENIGFGMIIGLMFGMVISMEYDKDEDKKK